MLWVRRLHGEKSAAIDHFNTHSISAFVTAGSKMLAMLLMLIYPLPLLLPRPRLPSLLLPSLLLPSLLLPSLLLPGKSNSLLLLLLLLAVS